jgi:hypothetical protein
MSMMISGIGNRAEHAGKWGTAALMIVVGVSGVAAPPPLHRIETCRDGGDAANLTSIDKGDDL